jgi:hypothetical protein
MAYKIIFLSLVIEALTFISFSAAPIIWLRTLLIRLTPFLSSRRQQLHPLNCNICTGFYIAVCVIIFHEFFYNRFLIVFFELVVCYRLSIVISNFYLSITNFFNRNLTNKQGCK